MVVKAQYICSIQVDTNGYCSQQPVPTHKILHPRLEVNVATDFHDIPKSVCNRTQEEIFISRQPICLTASDYNYILEDIGHREKNVC